MEPRFIYQLALLSGGCLLAGTLHAADPVTAARQAMETSLSRQREAVSAMAPSLELQRRSLQNQPRPQPGSSFFTLPPLPPLPPAAGSVIPLGNSTAPCPPLASAELDPLINDAAEREDLAPDLLRGVIQQESAARPCAVSSKGALGLMQLMPGTALQLGVSDALDPKENVDAGARFLKQLLRSYGGDVSLALGAFNAGPAKVTQAGGLPDYPETIDYVRKVLSLIPPVQ